MPDPTRPSHAWAAYARPGHRPIDEQASVEARPPGGSLYVPRQPSRLLPP